MNTPIIEEDASGARPVPSREKLSGVKVSFGECWPRPLRVRLRVDRTRLAGLTGLGCGVQRILE